MAVTITGSMQPFWPGDTVRWQVTLSINSALADLRSDSVKWLLKVRAADADSAAVFSWAANVAAQGASGVAIVDVPASLTAGIEPRRYANQLLWERPDGFVRHIDLPDQPVKG